MDIEHLLQAAARIAHHTRQQVPSATWSNWQRRPASWRGPGPGRCRAQAVIEEACDVLLTALAGGRLRGDHRQRDGG
jgi:hypothetical protein